LVRRLEALGRGDEAKGVLFDGWKAWFDAVVVVVALKVSLVGEQAPASATRGCRCCCPREALVDLNSALKIEAKLRAEL
jgi:hypothetical protein